LKETVFNERWVVGRTLRNADKTPEDQESKANKTDQKMNVGDKMLDNQKVQRVGENVEQSAEPTRVAVDGRASLSSTEVTPQANLTRLRSWVEKHKDVFYQLDDALAGGEAARPQLLTALQALRAREPQLRQSLKDLASDMNPETIQVQDDKYEPKSVSSSPSQNHRMVGDQSRLNAANDFVAHARAELKENLNRMN
jgi:hypothetical protein